MSLRVLAIVLTVLLVLPAVALIVRDAVAAYDRATPVSERVMHVVWTAVPIVFLVVLFDLSVRAA